MVFMFGSYLYIAIKNLKELKGFKFFFMFLFWVIIIGIIITVGIMVFSLLFNHTKLVLKECGTIDDMGFRDNAYNFGKIRNLKFIFKSYIGFFLPI